MDASREARPFIGQYWPVLPLTQLHDAEGRELLLANFSQASRHIIANLAQENIVIVDAGYSDMLMLDCPAPRPPGFELYHVAKLITRQDAANMLGMPSLCIQYHRQSSMPVVRKLYALP